MAGYEYVSAEQLAGFDKYKVCSGKAAAGGLRGGPRAARGMPGGRRGGRMLNGGARGFAEGGMRRGCWKHMAGGQEVLPGEPIWERPAAAGREERSGGLGCGWVEAIVMPTRGMARKGCGERAMRPSGLGAAWCARRRSLVQ